MRPDDALFAIVPCTGFLTFFAIIFGTLIVVRWFRHRELVAMAEKGLLPEQLAEQAAARRSGSRGFLVWGAVLTGLGLALFLGLGLLIVYFVTRKEDKAAAAEAAEETDVAAG